MGKKTKTREHDFSITAFRVVQKATGEEDMESTPSVASIEGKNPHAVALGHLGGLKGGKLRAEKLTPERRKEIAVKAAKMRWHGNPTKGTEGSD